ncbi:MAG: 4-alpha-glucanotransferase [Defluviitaleaceae bacterium]|nr:4-alpha-glucanotransferase [Defluviitaleaceae bacterium]
MRTSGLLMHITSLYTNFGIGDLGKAAYDFVDFLQMGKQSIWQILPINPTGFGDSPYQCFSTFAGNPLLICPDKMVDMGLLNKNDLHHNFNFPNNIVDYACVTQLKNNLFRRAYQAFVQCKNFASFNRANAHWLEGYAKFMAFKANDADEADYQKFLQYIFFKQFGELKSYAGGKGIKIMGDMPIFVAFDSADRWENPHLFQLDADGQPTAVAGVPPDYFSEDGQLWGNPLYNWKAHKADNYTWWVNRLKKALECFDIVRLDHFRGFESYWAIPNGASTAKEGKWMPGPGKAFFDAIKQKLGQIPLVAEDLGIITPAVEKLLIKTGLPGMRVLQFAFGGNAQNTHLPHNFTCNTVVYTGTHDNDTTAGWYAVADEKTCDHFRRYLNVNGENPAHDMMRAAFLSTAKMAMIPIQDLLALDKQHRMNTPGTTHGNWQFRLAQNQLHPNLAAQLQTLSQLSNRNC